MNFHNEREKKRGGVGISVRRSGVKKGREEETKREGKRGVH